MTRTPLTPTRVRKRRRSKVASSGAADNAAISENLSDPASPEAKSIHAADGRHASPARRRRKAQRLCPKCGNPFVRMHRRFADRILSVFNPVRRYGCTNHLCGHETVLWKSSTLGQRPIVAAAGLAGAVVAGAVVMGLALYLASDRSTRVEMRDAYSSAMHGNVEYPNDSTLALPVAHELPEPKYDSPTLLEERSRIDDLTAGLTPPVPASAPSTGPNESESPVRRE